MQLRGPGYQATLRIADGAVLVSAGKVQRVALRAAQALIAEHRDLAVEAFRRTLNHQTPASLEALQAEADLGGDDDA